MRVFFSHSSKDKPLIREVINYLPDNINKWIDESHLPAGENVSSSLRKTINDVADLVIFFVSNDSVSSVWVNKELEWALTRETNLGYTFILPVLIDKSSWNKIKIKEFRNRKYLFLNSNEKLDVKLLAKKLENEIYSWLIARNKENKEKTSIDKISISKNVAESMDKIKNYSDNEAKFTIISIICLIIIVVIYYFFIHDDYPLVFFNEELNQSWKEYYYRLPEWFKYIAYIMVAPVLIFRMFIEYSKVKIKNFIMNTLTSNEKYKVLEVISTSQHFKDLAKEITKELK